MIEIKQIWKTLPFLALFACQGNEVVSKDTEGEIYHNEAFENEVPIVITPKIAGTYTGTLPCADCEGIETILEIETDGSYHLTSHYLTNKSEEQKTHEDNGMIEWDKIQNKMTFISMIDTIRFYYEIKENELLQLNQSGTPLGGDTTSPYLLQKLLQKTE